MRVGLVLGPGTTGMSSGGTYTDVVGGESDVTGGVGEDEDIVGVADVGVASAGMAGLKMGGAKEEEVGGAGEGVDIGLPGIRAGGMKGLGRRSDVGGGGEVVDTLVRLCEMGELQRWDVQQ